MESPNPLEHPDLRAAARWPVADVAALAERLPNAGLRKEVTALLRLAAHHRTVQELCDLATAAPRPEYGHRGPHWLSDTLAARPAAEVAGLAKALHPVHSDELVRDLATRSSVSRLIDLADAFRSRSLEYEVALMFREAAFRHPDQPGLVAAVEERPRDLAYVFNRPNYPIDQFRRKYSGAVTAPRSYRLPESPIPTIAACAVLLILALIPMELIPSVAAYIPALSSYLYTGTIITLAIALLLTAACAAGFSRVPTASSWVFGVGGYTGGAILFLPGAETWMTLPVVIVVGSTWMLLARRRYDSDQLRTWYLKTIDRCGLGAPRTLLLLGRLDQDASRVDEAIGWYEQVTVIPHTRHASEAMAALITLELERQAPDRADRWRLRLDGAIPTRQPQRYSR